jgi:hypothetical protein
MSGFVKFLMFLCVFLGAKAGRAQGTLDLTTRIGGVYGQITSDRPDSDFTEPLTFGGFNFSVGWNRDLTTNLNFELGANVLMDVFNSQILRQGFETDFAYALFGGTMRHFRAIGPARIVSASLSSFSIFFRSGFYNYGAASQDGSVEVKGSVLELRNGFQFRQTISDVSAFGLESTGTLYSVPSSTSRLSVRLGEISLFFRSLY